MIEETDVKVLHLSGGKLTGYLLESPYSDRWLLFTNNHHFVGMTIRGDEALAQSFLDEWLDVQKANRREQGKNE